MNENSLEPLFIPTTSDPGPLADLARDEAALGQVRHAVDSLPFNTVYDFMRSAAREMAQEGLTDKAISYIGAFDEMFTRAGDPDRQSLDYHAALMQIKGALQYRAGQTDEALATAAMTLQLLAQEPKRKDEPFLSVLASLLYDIALIQNERGEYKQAERSLEKSTRLFERLARIDAARYSAPHLLAMSATTKVYRSRSKQAEALTALHQQTESYMEQTEEGAEDAAMKLIDILAEEGRTLAKMGRHREAIQFLSRAIRMLTRLEPELSERGLGISVDLGISLLTQKSTRDKGIHLLNTMMHKATKLRADEEYQRISDALSHDKEGTFNILSIWHKIFPR
ncbi:MAG: hypothetical protein K2J18_05300 [Paramuribaculum sp.]|nr:hypothetical protein [Paramuribaculum sp.]